MINVFFIVVLVISCLAIGFAIGWGQSVNYMMDYIEKHNEELFQNYIDHIRG